MRTPPCREATLQVRRSGSVHGRLIAIDCADGILRGGKEVQHEAAETATSSATGRLGKLLGFEPNVAAGLVLR
jgi:hypothetical protein